MGTGNVLHFFIEKEYLKDEDIHVRRHFFKKLLEYTDDINLQNAHGQTPLMLACKMKDEVAVEMLALNPSIQIWHRDHNGENLLHYLFKDIYESCNLESLCEIREKRLHILTIFHDCIVSWDIAPAIPGLMGGPNCPSKCALRHRDRAVKEQFNTYDSDNKWVDRVEK